MIDILFFAQLRERLGVATLQIESSQVTTVQDVIAKLKSHSADWQTILEQQDILVALNQEFVHWTQAVVAGDEVALFPPVTGG